MSYPPKVQAVFDEMMEKVLIYFEEKIDEVLCM
jgi:hypothetical protein